jgi:hypothetical protein
MTNDPPDTPLARLAALPKRVQTSHRAEAEQLIHDVITALRAANGALGAGNPSAARHILRKLIYPPRTVSTPADQIVWKPVIGFEDRYEVSSAGDIRVRYSKLDVPVYYSRNPYSNTIYPIVFFDVEEHRRISVVLARIVATAFHGWPPHPQSFVSYLDGDPENVDAANLQWSPKTGSIPMYPHKLADDIGYVVPPDDLASYDPNE